MARKRYRTPRGCSRTTKVQSLILSKSTFTKAEAKTWAKDHGFKYGKVDSTPRTWRLRQESPREYCKSTFRTKSFRKGVKAVIGKRKLK